MKPLYTLILVLSTSFSYAQLFVDSYYNAEEMLLDFFNSSDVSVSNIQTSGFYANTAFFDASATNLEVKNGIVLSTGHVFGLPGPAGNPTGNPESTSFGMSGDVDISIASGGASFDANFIQFEFVSSTSQLFHFNYVFASEEYPEYVGSQFNDAFLFLVAGPGYNGLYSNNAENIAMVPNQFIPVTINNVNHNDNTEYYIDNNSSVNFCMDGLTTMLEASFYAEADVTYLIKIVVSDVGDAIFDSAVFLGYNSLGNGLELKPPTEFASNINGNKVELNNETKYATEYKWDFGNGEQSTNKDPGEIEYDLPGTYDICLIANNSTGIDTFIQQIEILPQAMEVNAQVLQHVSCFGEEDGEISIDISSGFPPYEIEILPAVDDYSQVPAGQYVYEITDNAGSVVNGSIMVEQPSELLFSEEIINELNDEGQGSIEIDVEGGSEPYQYYWSTGDTTHFLSELEAGIYHVTVQDENGCELIDSFEVESTYSPLAVIAKKADISCHGLMDGTLDIEISGALAPYEISIEPSISLPAENLSKGKYYYRITSSDGQEIIDSLTIEEPLELLAEIDKQDSEWGKEDGYIEINVDGGTAPYSYLWNTGDTVSMISNLEAGMYEVDIIDANGCSINKVIEIIQTYSVLTVQAEIGHILCYAGTSGQANLNISGGATPYEIITDPEITFPAEDLKAGWYYYTISSEDGQQIQDSFEIVQPEELLVEVEKMDAEAGKENGSAIAEVEGGMAPYAYLWSTGETTEEINNLPAGPYSVEITDANDCKTATEVEIQALVSTVEIDNQVRIFPNPAQDYLMVSIPGQTIERIVCYNIQGKKVQLQLEGNKLNVDELIPGVYQLEIQSKEGKYWKKKWIKE